MTIRKPSDFTVGQTVLVQLPYRRTVEVVEREVTKVGRKWVSIGSLWRFDPTDPYQQLDGYSNQSCRVWFNRAEYEAWEREQTIESTFNRLTKKGFSAPKYTVEQMTAVIAILDPDAENTHDR